MATVDEMVMRHCFCGCIRWWVAQGVAIGLFCVVVALMFSAMIIAVVDMAVPSFRAYLDDTLSFVIKCLVIGYCVCAVGFTVIVLYDLYLKKHYRKVIAVMDVLERASSVR